jgi:hypothetical protein
VVAIRFYALSRRHLVGTCGRDDALGCGLWPVDERIKTFQKSSDVLEKNYLFKKGESIERNELGIKSQKSLSFYMDQLEHRVRIVTS